MVNFGVFEKLQKATISFVMSVRLSVRMEQLVSSWTDFHEIRDLSIFRKEDEKNYFSIPSHKNNGYFT